MFYRKTGNSAIHLPYFKHKFKRVAVTKMDFLLKRTIFACLFYFTIQIKYGAFHVPLHSNDTSNKPEG